MNIIIRRQDRIHCVLTKWRPIAGKARLLGRKDDVGSPLFQQLKRLDCVIDHAQIYVNIRADAAEAVQNLRHPVHGDAGVGRDTDGIALFVGDGCDLVLQLRVRAQELPDRRDERLPFFS